MEDKMNKHFNLETPVLLIGFNRPYTIQKVFEKIREVKPAKLYVAIDGARKNREGEAKLVENVKQIVTQVDWKCEKHYKFNTENLGAEKTISNAVTWALEENDVVIVLEDDIIAPRSFFKFAQEMLIKYANNINVYMISGIQNTPIEMPNNEDYLFGIYGHIWGWATWKRAWRNYDLYINDFDDYLQGDKIDSLVSNKAEKKYWLNIIHRMKNNGAGNNTWDFCWSYIRFKERGLSIIPRTNLTSNIGTEGLHARGKTDNHFRPFDENFSINKHPINIYHNVEYDIYHFEKYLNKKMPIFKRVFLKSLSMVSFNPTTIHS